MAQRALRALKKSQLDRPWRKPSQSWKKKCLIRMNLRCHIIGMEHTTELSKTNKISWRTKNKLLIRPKKWSLLNKWPESLKWGWLAAKLLPQLTQIILSRVKITNQGNSTLKPLNLDNLKWEKQPKATLVLRDHRCCLKQATRLERRRRL